MRHPLMCLFAIFLVLLSACGREFTAKNGQMMSEDDALKTLIDLPAGSRDAFGRRNPVSIQGLGELLKHLVETGQLKVPNQGRNAAGTFDLNSITQMLGLLQNSGSIFGLAQGLVNNGGTTQSKFNVEGILALLNAAMPIIMVIAPQYAPIIQAIVTILPVVLTFIQMFKKPSAAVGFGLHAKLA